MLYKVFAIVSFILGGAIFWLAHFECGLSILKALIAAFVFLLIGIEALIIGSAIPHHHKKKHE